MVLTDSLKKNNIILNAKSKNRWDLIDEMVDLAVKNKDINPDDRDLVRNALVEREKSMSTGIGNGVAIPHCTTPRVEELVIVLALCKNSIDFDAIDNSPVSIVILLLVPKIKLTQHIKTLANIAKMMSNDDLREKILTLKTAVSILNAMKKFEQPSQQKK